MEQALGYIDSLVPFMFRFAWRFVKANDLSGCVIGDLAVRNHVS